MAHDTKPFLGSPQPYSGFQSSVRFPRMGRPKKSGPPARIQLAIAHNLRTLIGRRYDKTKSLTEAHRKLAKDAGTSLSQVQRAIKGDSAIGVDTLERLADTFNVRAIDLATDGAFAAWTPPTDPEPIGKGGLKRLPAQSPVSSLKKLT